MEKKQIEVNDHKHVILDDIQVYAIPVKFNTKLFLMFILSNKTKSYV